MPVDVEPHKFDPLRWWDRFSREGRCRACYIPRWTHPTNCWMEARPWGDTQRLSWEEAIRRMLRRQAPAEAGEAPKCEP